jgi:hypothetical protein
MCARVRVFVYNFSDYVFGTDNVKFMLFSLLP